MNLDHYTYTGRGGRDYNEDAVGSKLSDNRAMFVLADGLGGHSMGETASQCVIDTLLSAFTGESAGADGRDFISGLLSLANDNILKLQEENYCVMKSTAVVLYIEDDTAVWAHVGDSRLYYIHEGRIDHITGDHSVAYKKYAAGQITRQELKTDEDQSVLLRSLGSRNRYEAETNTEPVRLTQGDAFLLCSDGLWEYLDDDEVLETFVSTKKSQDWARSLLARLEDRVDNTNDNISLITVVINPEQG